MAKTEAWFSLDSSDPLSLRSRLFADLVEKLATMDISQNEDTPELYRFSSATGRSIGVRIAKKRLEHEEGILLTIEFLNDDGSVAMKEEIIDAGFPSTHRYHPLSELVDLVDEKSANQLAEIKKNQRYPSKPFLTRKYFLRPISTEGDGRFLFDILCKKQYYNRVPEVRNYFFENLFATERRGAF